MFIYVNKPTCQDIVLHEGLLMNKIYQDKNISLNTIIYSFNDYVYIFIAKIYIILTNINDIFIYFFFKFVLNINNSTHILICINTYVCIGMYGNVHYHHDFSIVSMQIKFFSELFSKSKLI